MVPGHGYRTPQGALIDELWGSGCVISMEESKTLRDKRAPLTL